MTVNFMKRNKDNKAVVVKITPTKLNPPFPVENVNARQIASLTIQIHIDPM